MNWIKLSEQQPQEGQPIWWHATNIKTSRPNFHPGYVSNWFPYPEIILWQPASVPPPPFDMDEDAFEKWWITTVMSGNCGTKFWSKSAWNAALAWERKK